MMHWILRGAAILAARLCRRRSLRLPLYPARRAQGEGAGG